MGEDEMRFEDDPRAHEEQDHQRYFPKVQEVTFGNSGLADMMTPSDTNRYRHKYGSATQGTRYTYKKGDNNG
tara:strand:+ start:298 stop:513 length:216 start_codon:yes stop_codon:yes gene_type:complete